ncbi:MAG: type II secretion system protein GspG [Deltaproteobacteria bacterium]|nr:type II secretion system protein GspG [Deltaproteobacteria bacterium]
MRDGDPIVLGDKGRHRKSLGVLRRRLKLTALAAVAAMFVSYAVQDADRELKARQALVDIYKVIAAARLFRADNGRCPDGVAELAAPPSGTPYLRWTNDPWGTPYAVACPSPTAPNSVEASSAGPDRARGGNDNISSR